MGPPTEFNSQHTLLFKKVPEDARGSLTTPVWMIPDININNENRHTEYHSNFSMKHKDGIFTTIIVSSKYFLRTGSRESCNKKKKKKEITYYTSCKNIQCLKKPNKSSNILHIHYSVFARQSFKQLRSPRDF